MDIYWYIEQQSALMIVMTWPGPGCSSFSLGLDIYKWTTDKGHYMLRTAGSCM